MKKYLEINFLSRTFTDVTNKLIIREMDTIIMEVLTDAVLIMKDNIKKFGEANNKAWKESGAQIMERYQLTQKEALLVMRAAMSMVVGVIHPALA